MKFHPKYVGQRLGLKGHPELQSLTNTINSEGRMPDGAHRGTEYLNCYQLSYYWEDSSGWIHTRHSILIRGFASIH